MNNGFHTYLGFAFGAFFALTLVLYLYLVTFMPPASVDKDFIFALLDYMRWICAVSAGGITGVLTGFLVVNMTYGQKVAIQAGGALAAFVVVFFFNPSARVKPMIDERFRFQEALARSHELAVWEPSSTSPGQIRVGAEAAVRSLIEIAPERWESHRELGRFAGWFKLDWKTAEAEYLAAVKLFSGTMSAQEALEFIPPTGDELEYIRLCRGVGLSIFGLIRTSQSDDYDSCLTWLNRAQEVLEGSALKDESLEWGLSYDHMLLRHHKWQLQSSEDREPWTDLIRAWEELMTNDSRVELWVLYHIAGVYSIVINEERDENLVRGWEVEVDNILNRMLRLCASSSTSSVDRSGLWKYLTPVGGGPTWLPRPNDPIPIATLSAFVSKRVEFLSALKETLV